MRGLCACGCGQLAGEGLRFIHGHNRRTSAPGLRIEDRFMARVLKDTSGGCWLWMGHRGPKGYGTVSHAGQKHRAHRMSYVLHVGPIPPGMWVLHRCDNPPCVNPAHLFLGTVQDNARDMVNKGRDCRPCGEDSHWARLTTEQAAAIRVCSKQRDAVALGRAYGISALQSRRIFGRHSWRHLEHAR